MAPEYCPRRFSIAYRPRSILNARDHLDEIAIRTRTKKRQSMLSTKNTAVTLSVTSQVCHSEYIFANPTTGRPIKSMKTFGKACIARAGLAGIRIHDLRHTHASWAKQQGIDEVTIMDIMGHRTNSMVKRYAHTSNESLRAAVNRLEEVPLSDTVCDT